MDASSFDIRRFTKVEVFNRRAEALRPFFDRLNESRGLAVYKPYAAVFVTAKMSHIDTEDLDYFYKKLDQVKNLCALWHYYCVPKSEKKNPSTK